MKIIVTGATGQFGGLVIKYLLDNVSPSEIIAVVRDMAKASHLANLGVEVRQGDYNNIESLKGAFSGGHKLLFVSSPELDDTLRILQHANVVKAARDAQIRHIAYTSYAFAESSVLPLSNVHASTEYAIRTTNISYTFLRHSLYTDVFVTAELKDSVKSGVIVNNVGNGKLNTVTRNDLARAASVVLSGEGHENKSYNLVASKLWSYEDLASIVSKVSGKKVVYKAVSFDEYKNMLKSAGLPEAVVMMVAGINKAVSEGETSRTSDELERLIGSTTPLAETVRQILNS